VTEDDYVAYVFELMDATEHEFWRSSTKESLEYAARTLFARKVRAEVVADVIETVWGAIREEYGD
jgi:hypothetical protein